VQNWLIHSTTEQMGHYPCFKRVLKRKKQGKTWKNLWITKKNKKHCRPSQIHAVSIASGRAVLYNAASFLSAKPQYIGAA
jgi:hypothetical protein